VSTRIGRIFSTWPLLLQTNLAMAAGFSVLTYIYPVLSRACGNHGAMVSVALFVFGVASVGGSALGGRLTDRFGALPVVVVGLAALTLAMLAMSATTALSAGWPILVALAAWGLGGWTFPPSQQHRLIGLAPDEASVLLGLNSSAIYAGAAIGGVVGGLVLPAGAALVPAVAAGLAACALICVAVQGVPLSPARRAFPIGQDRRLSATLLSFRPARVPAEAIDGAPNDHFQKLGVDRFS
jgi:predicted MFS family arabinose efflux permease